MAISNRTKKKRGFSSLKSHSTILNFLEKEDTKFLNLFITHLKEKHNLNAGQIIDLITKKQEILIPATIFDSKKISPLESITKFLKENEELSYHKIALLLNRNDRTIWTVYSRSKLK